MKMIRLELIYIILHLCFDTSQIRHATFRADNFLHDPKIQHKINRLRLRGLTSLIKWTGLKLTYKVLHPYLDTARTRYVNLNCHPYMDIHQSIHCTVNKKVHPNLCDALCRKRQRTPFCYSHYFLSSPRRNQG